MKGELLFLALKTAEMSNGVKPLECGDEGVWGCVKDIYSYIQATNPELANRIVVSGLIFIGIITLGPAIIVPIINTLEDNKTKRD